MDLLRPVIQPYAWGSRHAIAGLQGRPVPSAGPEAELWMGAHPSAPSGLTRTGRNLTLDAVVAADPDDNKFCDCAIAAEADFVVTEDIHFDALKSAGYKPQPITPGEFIRLHLSAS